MTMDPHLIEMLPWYANGTLAPTDRAWVDDMLRSDSHAAAELAWFESLQRKVQDDAPDISDEIGLARTLKRIQANAALRIDAQQPRSAQAAPSLLARVKGWLDGLRLTPAFAMAALVIMVQAGVIWRLAAPDSDYDQIRAISGQATAAGALLRVNFKPQASETEIRMLLVSVQGTFEGGPGQLGDYYVRVATASAGQAAQRIKAAPIVESVQPVDGVPARGH
jgi:hypothetical protein